jgi:hypothetical protein
MFVQTQDYGVLLKMDKGAAIMKHLPLFIKVFLMNKGANSNSYAQCLIRTYGILLRLKKMKHPIYKVFLHNACAFNEEAGEICLSVLARGIDGSTKQQIDLCENKFLLTKWQIEMARDMGNTVSYDQFAKGYNHAEYTHDSAEVQPVVQAFLSMIRELRVNQFKVYGPDLQKYTSVAQGLAASVDHNSKPAFWKVGKDVYNKLIGKVNTQLPSHMVGNTTELGFWPGDNDHDDGFDFEPDAIDEGDKDLEDDDDSTEPSVRVDQAFNSPRSTHRQQQEPREQKRNPVVNGSGLVSDDNSDATSTMNVLESPGHAEKKSAPKQARSRKRKKKANKTKAPKKVVQIDDDEESEESTTDEGSDDFRNISTDEDDEPEGVRRSKRNKRVRGGYRFMQDCQALDF